MLSGIVLKLSYGQHFAWHERSVCMIWWEKKTGGWFNFSAFSLESAQELVAFFLQKMSAMKLICKYLCEFKRFFFIIITVFTASLWFSVDKKLPHGPLVSRWQGLVSSGFVSVFCVWKDSNTARHVPVFAVRIGPIVVIYILTSLLPQQFVWRLSSF